MDDEERSPLFGNDDAMSDGGRHSRLRESRNAKKHLIDSPRGLQGRVGERGRGEKIRQFCCSAEAITSAAGPVYNPAR